MKEKDFDDIGKRLYNQEADPPKDGMKNIHSMLHGPEKAGKVISIGKGWWKPLLLVAPLFMYWIYTELAMDRPEIASAIKDSGLSEAISQNVRESQVDEPENIERQSTGVIEQKQNNRSVGEVPGTQSQSSLQTGKSFVQKTVTEKNKISENQQQVIKDSSENPDNIHGFSNADSISLQSNKDTVRDTESNRIMTGQDESIRASTQDSTKQAALTMVPENISTKASSIQSDSINQIIVPENHSEQKNLQDNSNNAAHDKDTTSTAKNTPWRINASITPQYLTQPVQPDTNDEVLVTDINTNNKSYRMGFGAGIGIGKEISRDLYLDGHLTYTDIRQSLRLSYTTGNIDTLLAIQQPDQSVIVVPVYENSEREMSNHFGYAGLRMGATYYFWKKARSRFNITASAGLHYLVLAEIQEKIDGDWVSLSNEGLNRQNFSMAIGAGYNINLKQGWEIMINPVLTYFTQKVKNQALPYSFNQQLVGVNLMLSKTLGSKN